MLPLLIKRVGLDPAAACGPILTTVVDTLGFFMILGIASLFVARHAAAG